MYVVHYYICILFFVQFPVALTIKEDLNDFNKAEDPHEPDPKDLDVFDLSPEWQTLKPGQIWFL